MQVRHQTDRRTFIEFEHEGQTLRATWAQPFNQSYHPSAIRDIIIASKTGDAFAAAEMDYLRFNYKLTVTSGI
ncbi:hypothetical protein [uncultured Hymenobacter sp.]|uniref:hypothetical protein n=1 Tax=uncultured Hymenobacter sp. TaxID=170016 RepID=UPI0035CC6301